MDEDLLNRAFPEPPDEIGLTPIEIIDKDVANYEYRISTAREELPESAIWRFIGRHILGSTVRSTLGQIRYYKNEIEELLIKKRTLREESIDESD